MKTSMWGFPKSWGYPESFSPAPDPPRRHGNYRRSRTPTRTPRTSDVILTPAARHLDPGFIPTPDADDTWGSWRDSRDHTAPPRYDRPRSPRNPPSSTPLDEAPHGATSFRLATGDSEPPCVRIFKHDAVPNAFHRPAPRADGGGSPRRVVVGPDGAGLLARGVRATESARWVNRKWKNRCPGSKHY